LSPEPSKDSEHIVNPRQTPYPQPALGRAIRELRQQKGASLKSLAPEAGITLNMLSLIERGEANPTWETVRGIAAALGVPISGLAKAAERFES
jgi:transcriptional regulator with XRE-family HTH domain